MDTIAGPSPAAEGGDPTVGWLDTLAQQAQFATDPIEFIERVGEQLITIPWVAGGCWEVGELHGEFGEFAHHSLEFRSGFCALIGFSARKPTPQEAWQFHVLAGKVAEYLDIKLAALDAQMIAFDPEPDQGELPHAQQAVQPLVTGPNRLGRITGPQRLSEITGPHQLAGITGPHQLAGITGPQRRAGMTGPNRLARLTGPQRLSEITGPHRLAGASGAQRIIDWVSPEQWWSNLQHSHTNSRIMFAPLPQGSGKELIPRDLFDEAADNLINNALQKRKRQGELKIEVALVIGPQMRLQVSDDGCSIEPNLVQDLFRGPVQSERGHGMGLFQLHRLAARDGFDLTLAVNQPGAVMFALTGAPLIQPAEVVGDS